MSVKGVAARRFKDPNRLTPYEQKLWEKYNEGLTLKEIAAHLGYTGTEGVRTRLIVVKEKMAAANE